MLSFGKPNFAITKDQANYTDGLSLANSLGYADNQCAAFAMGYSDAFNHVYNIEDVAVDFANPYYKGWETVTRMMVNTI